MTSYSLFPLGDSAMTLDLGNSIDEHHNIRVQAVHDWLREHVFPGMLDVIVAYGSVSVFYDPGVLRANGSAPGGIAGFSAPGGIAGGSAAVGAAGFSAAHWVRELLVRAWEETAGTGPGRAERPGVSGPDPAERGHFFRIPVCYEGAYAPDLGLVAEAVGLSAPEVVGLHSAGIYRVYMLGFLPGFPYLGTVDKKLQVPRKTRPVPVVAGAVGITGGQTGIYPLNSPGGWSIIGRTPLKLFDPYADPPVKLQTGDSVQFYPISPEQFRELTGRPG
jgi:inhibitor of KinA